MSAKCCLDKESVPGSAATLHWSHRIGTVWSTSGSLNYLSGTYLIWVSAEQLCWNLSRKSVNSTKFSSNMAMHALICWDLQSYFSFLQMHCENLAMPFFTKIILTLLICAGHLSMKISNQTSWQPRKSRVTQQSVHKDGSLKSWLWQVLNACIFHCL